MRAASSQGEIITSSEYYRAAVASYVAAGGEETVQRVVTAIHALHRRLNQWYDAQMVDLHLSQGEWTVLSSLAMAAEGTALTPSALAEAASVAPSSMTHRLDRMTARGLVSRETDPANRTRVLVRLTTDGWELFTEVVRGSDLVETDVLSALSGDERAQLAGLLERVVSGLDAHLAE
ncbi:MarR family transcriptional regulator [Dermatophilaceae bacterium Soc4.6]